jgi:hypothetical protein
MNLGVGCVACCARILVCSVLLSVGFMATVTLKKVVSPCLHYFIADTELQFSGCYICVHL